MTWPATCCTFLLWSLYKLDRLEDTVYKLWLQLFWTVLCVPEIRLESYVCPQMKKR